MSFELAHNYSAYQCYCTIKRNLEICYHQINLVEACAIDLIDAIVLQKEKSWYHVICALLQRIKIQPLKRAFLQSKNIFTFGVKGRKDHEQLSRTLAESVEQSTWVRLEYYYCPHKIVSRFLRFWKGVKKLPLSFKNRIFLASRMVGYSCVIDELEKSFRDISLTGKSYIPFCAPIYHEALLTLWLKSKSVRTYFTFHGVFGRYRHQITNDVVMGENVLSDYVLAFGDTQRQDLIRDFNVDAKKIYIVGNPKYPYHPISLKNMYTSCIILGGIGLYDKDLRELLLVVEDIAKRSNISFALKPHPLSNIQTDEVWKKVTHISLIDKTQTIQSLFASNEYDFAITHNTSSYYECFIAGLKPFRWAKDENIDFEGLDDRFVNGEQLLEKIGNASKMPKEILSQEAESLLKNVLGYGLNKYNQYINE